MRFSAFGGLLLVLALPLHAAEGSVWDGVYTTTQAASGAAIFADQCKACHADQPGATGGHGPAPAVFGEDFRFRWLDASLLDVLDTIRQTMPEAAPNSLSAGEYAALTAYILKLNGYPAGVSELDPSAREALANIYIEERR